MTARKPLVVGTGNLVGELAATDALDGVSGYVEKATPPTSADYRRPIIDGDRWFNTSTGVAYVRVAGAWVAEDDSDALRRYVPVYLSDGTYTPVALNADGSIPVWLSNDTYTPIQTQV